MFSALHHSRTVETHFESRCRAAAVCMAESFAHTRRAADRSYGRTKTRQSSVRTPLFRAFDHVNGPQPIDRRG